jgi:hypothetical protein
MRCTLRILLMATLVFVQMACCIKPTNVNVSCSDLEYVKNIEPGITVEELKSGLDKREIPWSADERSIYVDFVYPPDLSGLTWGELYTFHNDGITVTSIDYGFSH